MNTVLLLCSIGVIVFYTNGTSGDNQINQIETTPREKPPKLLWDPEKRMWIENDDEDFYSKDYTGDDKDTGSGDLSIFDSPDNGTTLIETPDLSSNVHPDCNVCNITEDVKTEGVTNPIPTTILPLDIQITYLDKTVPILTTDPTDSYIKHEDKPTSSIDVPLNQALDHSSYKNGDVSHEKIIQSHKDIGVEVNPATEYPLWVLEFESKRTRPLQHELAEVAPTEQNAIDGNVTIGITKLQVIPLAEDESPEENHKKSRNSKGTTVGTDLTHTSNSKIINIQTIKDEPENSEPIPPMELDLDSDTDIEYRNPINTGIKEVLPKPTVISPLNPLLTNNSLPDLKDDGTHTEEMGRPTPSKISGEQNNLVTSIPGDNNLWTSSSPVQGNVTESPPATNTPNETDYNVTSDRNDVKKTCLPSSSKLGETTLHWPETPYNVTTIPQEICLDQDGTPVTRTCSNGVWSHVNGTCSNIEFSTRTLVLSELLNSKKTISSNITKSLTEISTDVLNITSYQIHLMSKLLEKITNSPETIDTNRVAQAVSNIMHCETKQLKLSQYMLNSTDKILYSLDDSLLKTTPSEYGQWSIITEKLLVQEASLQKVNFSGFRLENSGSEKGFLPNDLTALNENMESINRSSGNLELALLVSEELKNIVRQCNGSHANPNIITTVFFDDVLFNNNETTDRPEGKIISIMLPGFNCPFNAPLKIIFKPPSNSTDERRCAYWHYGSNERAENIKGHWVVDGAPKQFLNTTYQLCEFSHVTHFSLLVLGDFAGTISERDKLALDIITAVGSGLSLLGLIAVFLTAIAFRSYRSANAVVIHFSVAMAAQIVLLFMADHTSEDKLMCTIFGAVLHYVVLSQFCWMLTIALLQYKRYVLVFSNPTKYLMIKACAFAWGIPLIPVIVITVISPDNYGANSYGLCYAIGNYFIFGVLIPVAVIVFLNLLVFLRIMIYIASRKIKAHRKMDNTTSLQLRLAIMLYFLLGLTWGFGLIAAIGGGIVYSYLFCFTATLQGFVLFLFFIALSDKTRALWGGMLWCRPCLDKTKKYDVNTDSSSHPMVRRPTSTNTSDTFSDGPGNDLYQKYKNRSSSDF